jgi:hypothetical protein
MAGKPLRIARTPHQSQPRSLKAKRGHLTIKSVEKLLREPSVFKNFPLKSKTFSSQHSDAQANLSTPKAHMSDPYVRHAPRLVRCNEAPFCCYTSAAVEEVLNFASLFSNLMKRFMK